MVLLQWLNLILQPCIGTGFLLYYKMFLSLLHLFIQHTSVFNKALSWRQSETLFNTIVFRLSDVQTIESAKRKALM